MSVGKRSPVLKWVILLAASFQMISQSVTPAISQIAAHFSDYSIGSIQTAVQITSFACMLTSLITSLVTYLTGKSAPRKLMAVTGFSILVSIPVITYFVHSSYWNLYLYGLLTGIAAGVYVPVIASYILVLFPPEERRTLSGLQTTFVNGGGILFSLLGGALASISWFACYSSFLSALPVLILCIVFLPSDKSIAAENKKTGSAKRGPVNKNVFYYTAITAFFMLIFAVCGANLSVYIQDQLKLGDSFLAGIVSSLQLGGGALFGIFFGRFSAKLRDYVFSTAFLVAAAAFLILSFANSAIMVTIGAVLLGTTMSMVMPQSIYSVSLYVDESTSVLASALVGSFGTGLGSFLSPIIMTNVTQQMFGDSISARYMFTAVVSLGISAALLVLTNIRTKRGLGPQPTNK